MAKQWTTRELLEIDGGLIEEAIGKYSKRYEGRGVLHLGNSTYRFKTEQMDYPELNHTEYRVYWIEENEKDE